MEAFNVNWSSYDKRHSYVIGLLMYDKKWYFKYNENIIEEAMINGFMPFPDMLDINKIYECESLFLVFSERYKEKNPSQIISVMKNNPGNLATDKILIKYVTDQRVR